MTRFAIRSPEVRTVTQKTAFGRNDEPGRVRVQRLGDETLADLRAVRVRGVNEIDVQRLP